MAVPPRSGTFMGSISFKSPDGQMVWYALEVRASEADVIDTIQVTAQVRRRICVWVWRGKEA